MCWTFSYDVEDKDKKVSQTFPWRAADEEPSITDERLAQEAALVQGLKWVWERHNAFLGGAKDPATPENYEDLVLGLREKYPLP